MANMTRIHFRKLADQLASCQPVGKGVAYRQWLADCKAIADSCGFFNYNFDRARFLTACGLSKKEMA